MNEQLTRNLSRKSRWLAFPIILVLTQCQLFQNDPGIPELLSDVESISGSEAYLASPYVTAGDRLYMVGHQDGTFPDLGWHVKGEMGGIWDHPVKLMDGFTASIKTNSQTYCLSEADSFINYPFANKHIYRSVYSGLQVERLQFVPDRQEAVAILFTFKNLEAVGKTFTFEFNGFSDLRPVWQGEKTGMEDGDDRATWDETSGTWMIKDGLNEWHVVYGSEKKPSGNTQNGESCEYAPAGKGTSAALKYNISVAPGSELTLPIVIAGSYQSLESAKETYERVLKNTARLFREKKERYAGIAETAKLTIPDKELEQAFRWVKYNTDWLIRDVPEIGRGLSAGIPDYPWWFGVDNEYALQGAIATGRTDLVYSTIDLIHSISEKTNGNGRIIHEVSTNGAVFNPGNVNETPQFASLIWKVYRWTGDRQFLKKYYPVVKKGLNWLLRENDADGNLLPDGFGMMEIHGMDSEMIDVAAYSQKAFADAARMADALGDIEQASKYRQTAAQLHKKINEDFWVEPFYSYADFIGTAREALDLIDAAIVRADTLGKPWAVKELQATRTKIRRLPRDRKQGFVLHHNWVVNTPMEMGIADTTHAMAALETGSTFVNPFGMFVTGIDRDESAGSDESSFAAGKKVFTYTGAVMTLPTGVQAVAENNYGRPDNALDYIKRITRSFSYALPGSIYEVSPDFGMIAQAWNLYSYAVPIVEQFFGIRPMAAEKTVRIQPQMPASWRDVKLENVIVGGNVIDVTYKLSGNALQLTVRQTKHDWKIIIALPKGKYGQWRLFGEPISPRQAGKFDVLEISGDEIVLEIGN